MLKLTDLQLHCLAGDIIKAPHSTALTFCSKLTTGPFNQSFSFRFRPNESEAIHEKLKELLKTNETAPSQSENIETPTVLLTYLLLIVSRSENSHPLLSYANKIATAQKHFDFANISKGLRHLSKINQYQSEDTQSILSTLHASLITNKEHGKIMTSADISIAFFGLENADFSDPTIQQIVDELTWHTKQKTRLLSRPQLADSFVGFSKMQWNKTTENALSALFRHLQHLTQTKNWLDGRQLEMITRVIKHIPVDHDISSKISFEITQHIQGNTASMNWFESLMIELILQNIAHLKTHTNGLLPLAALFPHIQHTNKEYPLTFKGMEFILSILSTPFGIVFTEKTLPALLGHLESLYMEKSEEDFRSWLDHVLSPFNQYSTQSETISMFRQKALAISEPENSEEDSLFDDPNSDSPRTLTTGSDASLSEEDTYQNTSSHTNNASTMPETPHSIETQ